MSDQTHLASGPCGHAGCAPDTRREKRTTGPSIWVGAAAIAAALAWGSPAATESPVLSDEPDAKASSNESRNFASSIPLAAAFKVERVGAVYPSYMDQFCWNNECGPKRTESEIVMQRLDDLQTSLEERLEALAHRLKSIEDTLNESRDSLNEDVIQEAPGIDWDALFEEMERLDED